MKKFIEKSAPLAFVLLLLAAIFAGTLFQSCDDDDQNVGDPEIHYIRLTNPDVSDSLIVRAFLGNNIAIVGKNLQDVVEVWFNDQSARLNMNFITASVIIVTIPNNIPNVVTNEIRLVTRGGFEYSHEFNVDVPPPLLTSMVSEYVADGGVAILRGNFFIDDENVPLQVIFPGNLQGEILNVSINEVRVRVPDGAGVGPVTVRTMYGASRSSFYFRDDRGFILDWDNLNASGGWRSGQIRSNNPVEGINGNYVYFSGDFAGDNSTWNEDAFSFNLWGVANGRPQGDLFDIPIADAVLKFEVYVVEPWSAGALQMIFTPWGTTGTNAYIGNATTPRGLWSPWRATGTFETDGWITVTVPLSEFRFTHLGAPIGVADEGNWGGLTFFLWHGGVEGTDCSPVLCIDNIRVVPR